MAGADAGSRLRPGGPTGADHDADARHRRQVAGVQSQSQPLPRAASHPAPGGVGRRRSGAVALRPPRGHRRSGSSVAYPRAHDLDAQTFETWIRHTARTKSGREFFRVAAEAVFATEAANISLLHALFYARSGGRLEALLSSDGGAQQDRVIGGMQQLPQGLSDLLGDRVLLDFPVESIRQRDHGVVVRSGAREIDAGFAIVATPPATTSAISFDPRYRRIGRSCCNGCRTVRSSSSTRSTNRRSGGRTGCPAKPPATRAQSGDLRQLHHRAGRRASWSASSRAPRRSRRPATSSSCDGGGRGAGALLRSPSARHDRLHRHRLERRAVDPRLLRRAPSARGLDPVRVGPA